jgi:hypothetical protein
MPGESAGAVFAAPGLDAFAYGERGDEKADGGIEPPGAESGVGEQANQNCGSQVGAQQVLGAFAR